MTPSGSGPTYTCDCPSATMVFSDTLNKCLYYVGCSDKCFDKCDAISSDLNCYLQCKYADMVSTVQSTSIVSCACPSGKPYDSTAKRCLFTTGCDSRCNGQCIAQGSNTDCYGDCAPGMTKTGGTNSIFTCDCPASSSFESSIQTCLYSGVCSPKCFSSCSAPSSDISCYQQCKYADMIPTLQSPSIYQCSCPIGKPYDSTAGLCLYTSSCDPKCQSSCSAQSDSSACYLSCIHTSLEKTATAGAPPNIYTCQCPSGSSFEGTLNLCLYSTGCHPNCLNKCTALNDNSACYMDCASIELIKTTTSTSNIFKCQCSSSMIYDSSINRCIFTSSCDARCGKFCIAKNDNTACYQSCASPNYLSALTNPTNPAFGLTCNCPTSSVFYAPPVNMCMYITGCAPECGSYCSEQGNPSSCYMSCQSGLVKTGSGKIVSCSCFGAKEFVPEIKSCLYANNCHPLCGSMCYELDKSTECYQNCNGFAEMLRNLNGKVACGCPKGSTYDEVYLKIIKII